MKTSLITLLMVAGLATAGFGGSADAELKAIEETLSERLDLAANRLGAVAAEIAR